jgi:argininosuccinate lyase
MTLWSGRVGGGRLAPEVWEFLRAEDAELFPYDCRATALHARRLAAAGILTEAEAAEAEQLLASYRVNMVTREDEDVHSAIERLLGPLGAKIHAGRSRNDQVAAAFRLYVEDACAEAREAILGLAGVVLDLAETEAETPMPGYTHLQRAQPVTVGHHLLAWVEMLERDLVRFAFAAAQAALSPLGAGALAGSTLPLPAPEGAGQLRNSLDAVADRDFALDYLYACTVLFTHLSRIGEELVLWSTSEFGFARLPEAAATGSSMMPQKLNPDVAELIRGKAGTAIGRLTGLLAVVKGLPLSYDRDLQEDKRPAFDARRDTALALAALGVLIAGLELDHGRLAAACNDPLLLATDAAEALVREGVPRGPRAGRRAGACGYVRAARGARRAGDARAERRAGSGRGRPRAASLAENTSVSSRRGRESSTASTSPVRSSPGSDRRAPGCRPATLRPR